MPEKSVSAYAEYWLALPQKVVQELSLPKLPENLLTVLCLCIDISKAQHKLKARKAEMSTAVTTAPKRQRKQSRA